ncbi:MAG TPA: succinylglutamate desuccinylase/aspartoacylase family protein, partial [Reyranella sp.]|nr:succinylglutamate desuccinylase/aspartoacylase family protein [Reyranella sp.]
EMIAHYLETVLLPQCDAVIDVHSGGQSLRYVPSTHIRRSPDPARFARASALMAAFNAPYSRVFEGARETRALNAAAERYGIVALGTELSGGATVTPQALRIAERGLRRALAHLGALPPDPADEPARPDRRLQVGGYPFYVYARDEGVLEPLVALEDVVSAGQPAALIHPVDTPWQAPVEARFAQAGIVVCARVPGGRTRRLPLPPRRGARALKHDPSRLMAGTAPLRWRSWSSDERHRSGAVPAKINARARRSSPCRRHRLDASPAGAPAICWPAAP